ncbi:type I restriction enzyme, S subunit [Tindallia californiensis]|uniref:Type I restriction enzyme, S subunit n=1 Tax=Tindallia californiensis TaxID=159292 RepID=A0A1H3QNS7_9FIRM|nr:type I restriction enzyme, S subunit [Tindallia californiensis]
MHEYRNYKQVEKLINLSNYRVIAFLDVFDDLSSKGKKIKKENYLVDGDYAIIDQGNNDIAGYTNDSHGLYDNIPAIIFGDHTRCIKHIDFPFFLGADGVKLLKNKLGEKHANTKYLYYYLLSVDIPNTGYNRHFKFLKELLIPLPPIQTQQKIVEVLDKSQALIDQRKEQIELMDELIQSTFYEMFGDPVKNPKGWEEEKLAKFIDFITSGSRGWAKYYSNEGELFIRIQNVKNGKLNFESKQYVEAPKTQEANRTKVKKDDLIISITADLGRTAVVDESTEIYGAYINQHLCLLRLKKSIDPKYVSYYIESSGGKTQVQKLNQVGVKSGLNFNSIKALNLFVPPIALQNQFAEIVQKIEAQKQLMQESLVEMENNYNGLMQRAFKGELDF